MTGEKSLNWQMTEEKKQLNYGTHNPCAPRESQHAQLGQQMVCLFIWPMAIYVHFLVAQMLLTSH